ncbi:hypothetical protein [Herbiconiux sp.]|uniref:hypothetical protein n=1 Tax=Herbiconiux sp. TaxID=1871186 RepID=UPI0025C22CB3|nr:hypothetical protein [Herbiconiux sp.]
MDSNLLGLIVIGFLVVVIGLASFRVWARRKLRSTAAERKVTAVPGMLAEFSRSVVLGTDPATAQKLITNLPKRRAKELRPGVWGLNYVSADDVVIEVRPAGEGSEVLVTSVREHFGFPQGLEYWKAFAEKLEKAAAEASITSTRGLHTLHAAPAKPDSLDGGRWVIAA